MTPQTFSLEMCRLLSSLAPGFEGHYEHVPYLISGTTDDLLRYEVCCKFTQRQQLLLPYYDDVKLVFIWQVEDVLREGEVLRLKPRDVERIALILLGWHDGTAYQKIEEYLWTVLKQPKDKACIKAHCKCIQTDCLNHHYVDDK